MAAAMYETLRGAALGLPLPLEARSGLALLLRRGLWGWIRALGRVADAASPRCSPLPESTVPRQRSDMVHILAAMAMKANQRRAA